MLRQRDTGKQFYIFSFIFKQQEQVNVASQKKPERIGQFQVHSFSILF